uniref:Uncharacterized protein n=1 Tax=Catharus ustulatus TaxID=91951 RepID=A0A8C3XYY3_CATUS
GFPLSHKYLSIISIAPATAAPFSCSLHPSNPIIPTVSPLCGSCFVLAHSGLNGFCLLIFWHSHFCNHLLYGPSLLQIPGIPANHWQCPPWKLFSPLILEPWLIFFFF